MKHDEFLEKLAQCQKIASECIEHLSKEKKEHKLSAFKKHYSRIMNEVFAYRKNQIPEPGKRDILIWNAAIDEVLKLPASVLRDVEYIDHKRILDKIKALKEP
jgi:hypothetical protein